MASSPPNHASYICIMPRSNLPIIRNTCVLCLVAQLCSTLCNSMDCSPPGSSVHGNLQTRMLGWVTMPPSRGSSQPRDQTQVPTLQAYSLPTEPPGKPKNTGVGSLSLLLGIFLTQKSNRGLLHCRQILYQLSYQGSLQEYLINHKKQYSPNINKTTPLTDNVLSWPCEGPRWCLDLHWVNCQ